jgi:predicted dehydrogenase
VSEPSESHAEPVRVALIGYGLAGSAFHAPFIATTPGLRLDAIVTGNADRQREASTRHPGVRLVADIEQLWDEASAFDLMVVATPNRTHVPLALHALEAGLHVVVDKPLARTAAEGESLVREARRRGRMLTVYHNRRWDGDLLTLRGLLADGSLGRPLRFESAFERWRPALRSGWRESDAVEDAGGTLYDLGSHLIDQALLLFGPVTRVYAELARYRANSAVVDDAFLALEHSSGMRSHLRLGALVAQFGPRLRVLGDRAAYMKWGMDVQEAALRAGEPPTGALWGVEPEAQWGRIGADADVRAVPTERGDYGRFYAGVVAAIRDGAPPPVDPSDAVAGLAIIEAAIRSAAEHRVVAIE